MCYTVLTVGKPSAKGPVAKGHMRFTHPFLAPPEWTLGLGAQKGTAIRELEAGWKQARARATQGSRRESMQASARRRRRRTRSLSVS